MVQGGRGERGEKNKDNGNRIINKIYFKKPRKYREAEGRKSKLPDSHNPPAEQLLFPALAAQQDHLGA